MPIRKDKTVTPHQQYHYRNKSAVWGCISDLTQISELTGDYHHITPIYMLPVDVMLCTEVSAIANDAAHKYGALW